ncbi:MAG: hypothetical protein OIN66_04255 [Candidatus Methanoperedens sp.]|nr:hypothetical protein [Candidatus Methanoperedens sp.]
MNKINSVNSNLFFDTKLDFTYFKYIKFCQALIDSGLKILTLKDYLSMNELPEKFAIIRHDIDDESDLAYAMKMAEAEYELGFKTTYYFRSNEKVFNVDYIKRISGFGHEIGYHYEVLGEADGDFEEAIKLFESNLDKFRKICEIKTIAQHGGPLKNGLNVISFSNVLEIIMQTLRGQRIFDNWESKELWKRYDFKTYGIIGEPYLSLNFDEIMYLSDTNRSWVDTRYRIKDKIQSRRAIGVYNIKCTEDIIQELKSGRLRKVHILIHPSNWKDNFSDWTKWLLLQQIRTIGKRVLIIFWKAKLNS